ncbi:DUF4254 domain-containing protein [Nocardia vermiculata]|uniref:DUF4254 domain-containing protein n=1 Tax=Nocardia vermiculata TaxID=257274 RepID=A0A846YA54_9NOCA|nr:DUF4254 domain-containing protein [Nocardia vermiculata]NKY54098.1 DUF4254 domain-containing protein [Nocardia vermiculata]
MESLPPKHLLLEACRGLTNDGHPVLKCAYRLSELHEQRLSVAPGLTLDIDRDRAQLVSEIDSWVADELPRPHGAARMHTETVGTVIDRLAQFSALAYLTLTSEPEQLMHDAWRRLTELAVAYDDLAGEVTAGLCRLPDLSGHRERN